MSKYRCVLVEPKSPLVPLPRSGHRCVIDGVFLYVFGGFNPHVPTKLFSEIWCFNLSLKTWHNLPTSGPSPSCVASSTLILKRGKLIVFGGSGYPFGSQNSNKTYVCDLREQVWSEICGSCSDGHSLPAQSYGQSAVIGPDNCMYVFGGTKGLEYNNSLHKINLDSHTWEQLKCQNVPPSPRYRHEAICTSDGFIVIGGYGQHGACSLDIVFIYKYDHCMWTKVNCQGDDGNEFPGPRRAHSCVKYNDSAYLCGGYSEMNSVTDEANGYDDIWKLDLQTFSWYKIKQVLPFPSFFHSAAVTSEGCMYIFGGVEQINTDEQRRSNDVYKMWLVVPPLVELCWEVICNRRTLTRLDQDNLRKLGVPRHILARCQAKYPI